jgi:glutamate/aspartate transport system permease protein
MSDSWNWGVFVEETPEGGVHYWEFIVSGLGWTLAVSALAWVIAL